MSESALPYFGNLDAHGAAVRGKHAPQRMRSDLVRELFERHYRTLLRYLMRSTGNCEDAADLAQDAYVRLARCECLERFDCTQALLFKTATNLLRDRARRRKTQHADQHCAIDGLALVSPGASPEELLHSGQLMATLGRIPLAFDARRRRAFVLHRLDGLTHEQVAAKMGISVSTARRYIHDVVAQCRKTLEPLI